MTTNLQESTAEAAPTDGESSAPMPAETAPRVHTPETLRLYQADWDGFKRWCAAQRLTVLPAEATTVAAFLTAAANKIGTGALARRAAAITAKHRQAGHPSPAADPVVKTILRTVRLGAAPRQKPPKLPTELVRMGATCPGDLAGLRDRAILLLAGAGLDRSILVSIDLEAVRFTPAAVEILLHEKNGDAAALRHLAIPRGAAARTCAVAALEAWLHASDTQFGPVFRKIDRWGTISHHRLGADAVRRILLRRALRPRRRSRHPGKVAAT
jgi:site-specific recombinase XerC